MHIFKVMCDYCAEGFWINNACAEPASYLSPELSLELKKWNATYEKVPPVGIAHWEESIEFVNHGLKLAVAVKEELKSKYHQLTVLFYDPNRIIHHARAGSLPHERNYIIV